MTHSLEESYNYCRHVARTRAKNFYYSFLLLDRDQRDAMCALYTFNRVCDDISDEPDSHGYDSPRVAIEDWRQQLEAALGDGCDSHLAWPAFRDSVERFHIPHEYFHEMIAGVRSDLDRQSMETFEELYQYCYQVASTVGLSIIHIFGFESPDALRLAERCGIAFQLTNILRDVREDAGMGRVYLPAEDLARFGVEPALLRGREPNDAFRELMEFEVKRAQEYYAEAAPLVGLVDARSSGSLWALIQIYHRLLGRIEQAGFDVLRQRVRVPTWEKVFFLLKGRLRT